MIGMLAFAVFVLVACLIASVMSVRRGGRIVGLRGQRTEQHGGSGETLNG